MAEGLRRQLVRVRRHLGWARREGVGRLIEEDQLDPASAVACPPRAARGSATTRGSRPALARLPARGPAVGHQHARPRVRDLACLRRRERERRAGVRAVPAATARGGAGVHRARPARARPVKPLAESHRALELLDLGTPSPPVAVWAWRDVDDRVRSAVSKFGPNNLLTLQAIAAAERGRSSVDGPSQEMIELVRSGLSDERWRSSRGWTWTRWTPRRGRGLLVRAQPRLLRSRPRPARGRAPRVLRPDGARSRGRDAGALSDGGRGVRPRARGAHRATRCARPPALRCPPRSAPPATSSRPPARGRGAARGARLGRVIPLVGVGHVAQIPRLVGGVTGLAEQGDVVGTFPSPHVARPA